MSAVAEPAPLLDRAVQAWRRGDHHRARQLIDALLEGPRPQLGAAVLLARMELDEGHPQRALTALEHPQLTDHPVALLVGGAALLQLDRVDEAARRLRLACELAPQNAAAWDNLAEALRRKGNLRASAQALVTACTLHKETPDRGVRLGRLWLDLGQVGQAREVLARALRQGPRVDAMCLLSLAFALTNRGSEAQALARQASLLEPDNAQPWSALGCSLLSSGELESALSSFRRVLDLSPGDSAGISGVLVSLERLGRYEEIVAFARSVGSFQGEQAGAYRAMLLADLRAGGLPEAEGWLRDFLARTSSPRERRVALAALAEYLDKRGQYEQAFVAADQANQSVDLAWDEREFRHNAAANRAAFTASRVATLPRSRRRESLPVFIVGMPRSGTSLTAQILTAHTDVAGVGELKDITRILQHLALQLDDEGRWPRNLGGLTTEMLEEAGESYLTRLHELASGNPRRIVDKNPFNFSHLGIIDRMLPGARVVHCVRNPVDVGLSVFFQPFASSLPWATRQEWIGAFYQEYRATVDQFRESTQLAWIDVPYEELVKDPEGWSKRLCSFLGVEWQPACAHPERNRRQVNTASYDQVRQPVYTSSVERWRHYEPWLQPLVERVHKPYNDPM